MKQFSINIKQYMRQNKMFLQWIDKHKTALFYVNIFLCALDILLGISAQLAPLAYEIQEPFGFTIYYTLYSVLNLFSMMIASQKQHLLKKVVGYLISAYYFLIIFIFYSTSLS